MLKKVFKYDFISLFKEMMPLLLAGLAVDFMFLYSVRQSSDGDITGMPSSASFAMSFSTLSSAGLPVSLSAISISV